MRRLFPALLVTLLALPVMADPLLPGPFADAACIDCHQKETPEVVSQWRGGPHGANGAEPAAAGCNTCHGDQHQDASVNARHNDACITCHGGPKTSAVRSYLTSKHGVIAVIEDTEWDYSAPLADGNYRAPTCSYCHFHEGEHGDDGAEVARDACGDCHSPRFVDTLEEADEGAIGIGRMKVDEAAEAIEQARNSLKPEQVAELDRMIEVMRSGPLRYLWHGLVHHSPDYQWWYGQAALDGELLRIKAKLSEFLRERAIAADH